MTCNCVDEMPSVESCARCQNGGKPLPPYRDDHDRPLDESGLLPELWTVPTDLEPDEDEHETELPYVRPTHKLAPFQSEPGFTPLDTTSKPRRKPAPQKRKAAS